MLRDALGDRMKEFYENRSKTKLTRKMPVIIRLDGKAFHTFTRGFKKPFDEIMIKTMQQTMQYLCENIQGCILGYTQSDEITLVLQDYYKLETDAWFDYDVQKIISISAAMATLAFNKYYAANINNMCCEFCVNNTFLENGKCVNSCSISEGYGKDEIILEDKEISIGFVTTSEKISLSILISPLGLNQFFFSSRKDLCSILFILKENNCCLT